MNWNDLKIILALHRTGSQTAAAQMLRLNQSTVGRRLNTIEADLGIILFTRSKAGFEATEAGDVVIRAAKEMERRARFISSMRSAPISATCKALSESSPTTGSFVTSSYPA